MHLHTFYVREFGLNNIIAVLVPPQGHMHSVLWRRHSWAYNPVLQEIPAAEAFSIFCCSSVGLLGGNAVNLSTV